MLQAIDTSSMSVSLRRFVPGAHRDSAFGMAVAVRQYEVRCEAHMWYITTHGFSLQEIFIMAAMNVASGVKKQRPARAKAAKAASAAGSPSESL